MDNAKAVLEGNNFYVFVIVLIAIMGLFVLVGNVIKTYREIKKPRDDDREGLHIEVKELKHQVARIESVVDEHGNEIDDIRHMNRIQCQSVRALLNHAIHNGNTDEMEKASGELDKYLTEKI